MASSTSDVVAQQQDGGDDETLAPAAAAEHQQPTPTPPDTTAPSAPPAEDGDREEEKTLQVASKLFDKGSQAIEDDDYAEAADLLSRALEIRVANYGELAPECALTYYKYGCALLYKAQEEADPLVPKSAPKSAENDNPDLGDSEDSKALQNDDGQSNASHNNEEVKDGASDKDQEDENDDSDGDDEELEEADDYESDLDLAWKMLDVARIIVEKHPEDTMEKVNIFAALGEVSLEREDFETSLNDYLKALSILEKLVEPDHRRVVELNFRICLLLELWLKVKEAIPYCEKAIYLCKSRLKKLSEDVKPLAELENNATVLNDSSIGGSQTSGKGDADLPVQEDEKQALGGVLSELERKLEDLQHVLSNPKSMFTELMKAAVSRFPTGPSFSRADSKSPSLNSSQFGAANGGFDSPTISNVNTNGGGVTHLGVVGRGVKRASVNPLAGEPSSKKLSSDSALGKEGDKVSDSSTQDDETQQK